MLRFIFSICYIFSSASALPPCLLKNSQTREISSLYKEVALIESDNRALRNSGDISDEIEKSQGRIFCLNKKYLKKGVPSKQYMNSHGRSIANATLAFQADMAIVSRHLFINEDGSNKIGARNCYLEHISSGAIVKIDDVEFPDYDPKKPETFNDQDFAVVKLSQAPLGGGFIRGDNIIIDKDPELLRPIKVVSNYATNNSQGRGNEALTMTDCQRILQYSFSTGQPSNMYGTDCDTGDGSSGAQAYLKVEDKLKMFGIVSGDIKDLKDGGKFDPNALTTIVSGFDNTLFDSVKKLKNH